MSFDVAANAYDRFMGRYSSKLAPAFVDFAGVNAGQTVLDVGCGPGAATAELVRRLGQDAVAACVWDLAGGRAPVSTFWRAAQELHDHVQDESGLPGARAGHLSELFEAAGLRRVEEAALSASADHPSFDDWWEPFTFGVGPAGEYARTLGETELSALRERCRHLLPAGPFTLTAVAWAARGLA